MLREHISRMPSGAIGASSLTAAELRLLPLLQTHLTFRGIGERLFVSPHTVKTQAISIYRKLGVSSRADAVREASELGLLGA
jgi:LuxR family maltose regulon positive regulatory protein